MVNVAMAHSLQKDKKQSNSIPLEVMKILEKSCMNCHS